MATRTTEPWDMIEQWKAEHPDLANGIAAPAPPRPKPIPPPAPPAPEVNRAEQRAMIERWSQAHPELTGRAAPRPLVPPTREYEPPRSATRSDGSERTVVDIANTPLTVLSAFILGCIIGGIAMTIITGLAFWGFAGG